eukprot:TRINITY_DN8799_c0_g1_i1.p1 TRINITY_DN8799_c0_g1~~TRINITY_DN8799_c0_g1_i1.p1  ORF type:complete len:256 (-),score=56.44 TRINITY_DN8799_c0_g1_i1:201-902(-)
MEETKAYTSYQYGYLFKTSVISVSIYVMNDTCSFNFSGSSTTYSAGEVKVTIKVKQWPFMDPKNTISLLLMTSSSSESTSRPPVIDFNKNLRSFETKVGGQVIHSAMIPQVEIDGVVRISNISLISTSPLASVISINVSHFYDELVIDPNYAILTDPNDDADTESSAPASTPTELQTQKKSMLATIIVVPIACVMVAAIIAAITILYKKGYFMKKSEEEAASELSHVLKETTS